MNGLLILPVLLPLAGGAALPLLRRRSRKAHCIYIEAVVTLNSLLILLLLLVHPDTYFMAINLAGALAVTFHLDGLSRIFIGLIAFLWPFATLYAFEYMKNEKRQISFFAFYTMTYGITAGIALADNLMTLYMFYEMLTLVTVPLVMHKGDSKSMQAGYKYIRYSIAGAAMAFIGFIFVMTYADTISFQYGGVLNPAKAAGRQDLLLVVYLLAALGFGVKAAIFPASGWLPAASVAHTPVTALLHAVAVVNAGAYAMIRLTYYSFGAEFIKDTWAQNVLIALAAFTIVYGSVRAVKQQHLKRRLAYSTISNLSYIVLGIAMMSPAGMFGGLSHMIFHSFMKIALFLCAGAVMHQTGREYVQEIHGIGHTMPLVMGCFTVGAAALVGIPPLPGFLSKWNLAQAALECGSVMGILGVAALILSAVLTAVYLLSVVVRAYYCPASSEQAYFARDPNWQMKVPLLCFTFSTLLLGIASAPLLEFVSAVSRGLL